ncbi:putative membrane protein [Halalkaliarchaeum sp. AArc-CO]|uniref:DUF192 domain-containing protein n=1 Tax=unclassified Halalkaliarchaeum TaxID=2678344 RepID=UPI00217E42BE|nr:MULTISPECIES: DUF192 domain-containing protein [unclassified Halalkaliarchaeum]MDR5674725.1 DUF192 domain-containing protein [Halalkaliarchaeum sp. AArc-GB]UWG51876.1 putative membrane protein [Halalkaliarchaeum sp. AArc-CO]
MNERALGAAVVVVLLVAGIAVGMSLGLHERGDYEWTTVTIENADSGDRLATVDARIADTREKRYTGLSNTDDLAPDEGMWFVHDEPGTYDYIMRDMSFPIDIVFVDENGTITTIHEAPVEEDQSSLTTYTGYGQYVLEVNLGFTDEHGIEEGDLVVEPIHSPADDRDETT